MHGINELVSCETNERLKEYEALLLKWNSTINLISQDSIGSLFQRHILDSLQLLKFIDNHDISLADLGSGAGFPGIVLSIAGIRKVTLIESDSRKSAFLLQASKISSNEVKIINGRIEDVEDLECDILTARAFASLSKTFDFCKKIKVKDRYLLHKGNSYREEMSEAKKHWLFNVQIHDSITSKTGKILEISNVIYTP